MNEEAIAALEAKLKARRDRPGFAVNVKEIEAKIARLKQEAADGI